jgi:hypothetical protein
LGSVDGSRVWGKDIKGPGLSAVQWSPDNSLILFASTTGELHLYDNQGNYAVIEYFGNLIDGYLIVMFLRCLYPFTALRYLRTSSEWIGIRADRTTPHRLWPYAIKTAEFN